MNLLDATWQNIVSETMNDVFDTFARNLVIRFYKEVAQVFVPDANYNADFQRNGPNKNVKTPVFQDFQARVWYLDRQEIEQFLLGEDSNVRFNNDINKIRVQIPIAGLAFMESATRFEFNGSKWKKEGSVEQIGTLGAFTHVQCFLSRVV